jgi:hypothetical protein
MDKIKTDLVTREDLRNINVGETVVYVLPSPKKCMSVRSMVGYLKKAEGKVYSCTGQLLGNELTVTRKA